ncbi:MAG: DUF5995 family protein [Actinomycetota bacterium]|nr:DUF5995 family protein [Actinomycetota bacterium]
MSISVLIDQMETMLSAMDVGDPLRLFHGTYTRTTKAVASEIARGGFADNEWAERWDVAFADLYIDALRIWQAGERPSYPWQVALNACRGPHLPPLRYVLLGMNAHINFDLPQALLAVISTEEFDDPAVLTLRNADHVHIDAILASRVAAEDGELKKAELPGDRTLLDVLLTPFNRLGTKRFLREARTKVWLNARRLNAAPMQGQESFAATLAELETRSAERVNDLRKPGQVLLELSRNGFGVVLR